MKVSVIVVCYNERVNIGCCLQSLVDLQYPQEDYEILVVDNNSEDGTQEIIRGFQKDHPRIRLFINQERGIASSRNMGIKRAAYPYVAFTDADCQVPPEWLGVMVDGFKRHREYYPELVAAGGTNEAPAGVSSFYDSVNIVLKTLLGNRGSTQGREFSQDRLVDHIPTLNILYDKAMIISAGGFDEDFRFVCEDPELNHRLVKSNHKIVYLKDSRVSHRFRPGFLCWAKRTFSYGWGRTQIILRHPDHFSFIYLLPPAIILLWIGPPLFLWNPVAWWPIATYTLFLGLYALFHCLWRGKWWLVGHVLFLYLLTHLFYGLGEIWSLIHFGGRRVRSCWGGLAERMVTRE